MAYWLRAPPRCPRRRRPQCARGRAEQNGVGQLSPLPFLLAGVPWPLFLAGEGTKHTVFFDFVAPLTATHDTTIPTHALEKRVLLTKAGKTTLLAGTVDDGRFRH